MSSADEVMDSKTLLITEIPISLNYSIVFVTLQAIFKLKKAEEDLVEVEGKNHTIEEDVGHGGVTIESSKECRSQKVILEKPSMDVAHKTFVRKSPSQWQTDIRSIDR